MRIDRLKEKERLLERIRYVQAKTVTLLGASSLTDNMKMTIQ